MTPIIRSAELADVDALQAMFAEFVASTKYQQYVGNDPDYSTGLIERMITEDDGQIFVVQAEDGIIGMIGLVVVQHPMSGELVGIESFWWLNPKRRGYGAMLERRAVAWAKSKGAKKMHMMAPCDNPRVAEIYIALGYHPVETTYTKVLA